MEAKKHRKLKYLPPQGKFRGFVEVAGLKVPQCSETGAEMLVASVNMQFERVEKERDALMIELGRIANHMDQDHYGDDAWKDLALEMAQIAREAIASVEGGAK